MAAAEAVSVLDAMRAEFRTKGDLLGGAYPQVSPEAYYRAIFREAYGAQRVAGWTAAKGRPQARRKPRAGKHRRGKGQGCIRHFAGCGEMVQQSQSRSDAYTFLMDFFNDYPRTELLQRVYGLVVDLDGISVADVQHLLQTAFLQLPPSFVVNSGHGLHLVYAFERPIDAYKWAVYELDIVYRLLKEHFIADGTDYHVDNVGLVHMFRIVGSQTKIGCTCEAYQSGGAWPVAELAARLGYQWVEQRERKQCKASPKGQTQVTWKPNGCRAFYSRTKQRILAETPVGNRYMSMVALVTVGYKCYVPPSIVEADLRYLQQAFNSRHNGPVIRDNEIGKAMAAYNEKALRVRRETLNGWLGFEFAHQQRNGRSRAEHLARNRQSIHADKLAIIRNYLRLHPEASSSEIARRTPVSRQTVMRYRAEVEAELAAERVAAANETEQEAQTEEKGLEQLPVTAPAEVNRLVMRILSTGNVAKRERLIAYLPVSHQRIVRDWFSST